MRISVIFIAAISLLVFNACNDESSRDTQTADISEKTNWVLAPFAKIDSLNPILEKGVGMFNCPILQKTIKWENKDVFNPAIIGRDGKIYMLYRAEDTIGKYAGTSRIGLATSVDGLHFTRNAEPVLDPSNDDQKKF